MSSRYQVIRGLVVALVAAVVTALLPAGGFISMLFMALLALIVAVRGSSLPLSFRVAATGFTLYYSFEVCLLGRTMEPFLSAYTLRMTLLHFVLFAALPTMALLRAWRGTTQVLVCSLMLPVAFIVACSVATFEEFQFISLHRAGVGPTPRWTVPHHWLSYDATTKQLDGSD